MFFFLVVMVVVMLALGLFGKEALTNKQEPLSFMYINS